MPQPARRSSPARPSGPGAAIVVGALCAAAGIAVLFPALMVVGGVIRGIARDGPAGALEAGAIGQGAAILLLRTARTALVIGLLAMVLAWPVAWTLRARRGAWTGLMLAPMLLPSYLAYAGWGLLRSPGTWTGDWLASAPPPPWSAEPGYWPLLVGSILAVAGLALWAWPLAAVILASGASRVDGSVLEALRLERGPAWRKRLCILGMMRGPAVAAILAVALLMLGSAVPLHLAQMETYSTHIWLLLDQTPAERHWAVWAAAWPLVLVAVVASAVVSSRMIGPSHGGEAAGSQPERARTSRAAVLGAVVAWAAAVVGPAVLFAAFLPGWRALRTFWLVHHEPLVTSLALAGVVAPLSAGMAAAVWLGLSGGRRARIVAAWCVVVFLIGGLMPGVLVGSATAMAWNTWPSMRWMGDSPLVVTLGHLARFGFVPLLVGAFLAKSEAPEERHSRRLDGAEGLRGWASACLPGGLGTVVAAGLAAGVLSFHEIEAAVILQPPGLDSFPRQMLGFLHYARTQELCAGALLVIAVGLAGAFLAVGCDRLAGVRWRR